MAKLLKTNCSAALLVFAASMLLDCGVAFAEPDAQQEAIVISDEQIGAPAAADSGTQAVADKSADVLPAASGVPPTDTGNAGKDAATPDQKAAGQPDARILSSNPDDANKHPAWRKREANKILTDLPKIRRSMMQQGAQ